MANNPLLQVNAAAAVAPASDVMYGPSGVVGTGDRISDKPLNRTYQATVTGTGAVSATVIIEASNDLTGWVELGTMSPSGANMASAGMVSQTMWRHVRARCTAISATSSVKVTMGSGNV